MSYPWYVPYIGRWDSLVDTLDRTDRLRSWRQLEPDLAGYDTCQELRVAAADPSLGDAILGSLLRLGSVAGGDDPDAVLFAAHLLVPGCKRVVGHFGSEWETAESLIFGEFVLQARRYDRDRQARAHAANLLWRVDYGLRRHMSARRFGDTWVDDYAVDAPSLLLETSPMDQATPVDDERPFDLIDVLLWAERSEVVSADDVHLLLELAATDVPRGQDTAGVAASRGISKRTVERRRASALSALRTAAPAFSIAA